MATRLPDMDIAVTGFEAAVADDGPWFVARELAELALPGLGKSKRDLCRRADLEGWADRVDGMGRPLTRRRTGARGGSTEYHWSLLPASARMEMVRRGLIAAPAPQASDNGAAGLWDWYRQQPERVRLEAQRRAAIIDQIAAFEETGLSRTAAITAAATDHGVHEQTLWSWQKAVRGVATADRLPYLAPRRQGGGKSSEVDDDLWQMLLSDYLRLSQPRWQESYDRIAGAAASRGLTLPHVRTLWRKFQREVPELVVRLRREGAEKVRRSMPSQQRSVAELHALELVNMDGHICDVFVDWPGKGKIRPVMIAIQDVYSSKILAWRFAPSEDVETTRLVIADMVRKWGVPYGLLTDNSRTFASKALSGGAPSRFRGRIREEDPVGVLTALGIKIHWALPFRGQSKPIERAFRDIASAVAKSVEFEGAYTGKDVLSKPANYDSRMVDLETFTRVWNAGVEAHNRKPNRRGEMCGGKRSFNEVFADSYATAPIRKATGDDMRIALLAADRVRVDKRTASITLFGTLYWSEELIELAGQQVTVRFDPDNLREPIHVHDAQGRFTCMASPRTASPFLSKAEADQRRKLEKRWQRKAREQEEAMALLTASQLVAALPDDEAEDEHPEPRVVRPVRAFGPNVAAMRALPASVEAPERAAAFDRLAAAHERRHLKLID